MDQNEKLQSRIKLLQLSSFVLVGLYFVSKYALNLGESVYNLIFAVLLFVLLVRSFFEYKLTGNKTKLFIFLALFLLAAGVGTYFYLNPQPV